MTKKERMLAALRRQPVDRIPRELMGYAEDGYTIYKSPYGDIFKETPRSFQMLKPARLIGNVDLNYLHW